jgi:hypothetical protein
LENEDVTKPIGEGTSGLTSASQLVNTTSYITFAETNSTCATPTHMPSTVLFDLNKARKTILPQLVSRKEKFAEVLIASLQKNKQILKELAKY